MLDVVCPVAFEYFPRRHLVHDVTAVDPEYVPASQSVHTDRLFEYFPAGHAAHQVSHKSAAVWLCACGEVDSLARMLSLSGSLFFALTMSRYAVHFSSLALVHLLALSRHLPLTQTGFVHFRSFAVAPRAHAHTSSLTHSNILPVHVANLTLA